jgi:hypothetical protein
MADEVGLKIGGVLYPPPTGYTLGEARTIKQMTGLELPAFAAELERIATANEAAQKTGAPTEMNSDAFTAYVWVSMHRVNPSVTPGDVDNLDFSEIDAIGAERPPAVAGETPASGSSSETSAAESNGSQESSSDVIPFSSGIPQ